MSDATAPLLTNSASLHAEAQHLPPSRALYAKLHAVMRDCAYIQKDKRNSFHGYNYASEAAIKDKVHAALVKHGLLFVPIAMEILSREAGLGKDGKEALTTVRIAYKFIDVDSGEEQCGEWQGVGADALDKGSYKAVTGCVKYILTSTFLIPTGDDPEEEEQPSNGQKEPQKEKQLVAQSHQNGNGSAPHVAAAVRTEPPLRVQELWRMLSKDRESFVRVFADARGALEDIHGREDGTLKYLDTLHKHGIQSIDGYTGKMQPARACVAELFNLIQPATAAGEVPA